MNDAATMQRCLAYVETQLDPRPRVHAPRATGPVTITISRLTGSGGIPIAHQLAEFLQERRPGERAPWTVFDRELVQRMLLEHDLPTRLAEFMPEDRISYIQDTLEELVGLHPSRDSLVTGVTETILGLAELGNCIIIGRGSNLILAKSASAFHVRLVSALELRVRRVQEDKQISDAEARELIHREDQARARYVHQHFDADIADPLGYHLTLNTEWFSIEQAAELIGQAVLRHFPLPFERRVEHHVR